MEGRDVEIPRYFLCPISLQIMRAPVSIVTGITYERESTEKWLSKSSSNGATTTCLTSRCRGSSKRSASATRRMASTGSRP
ncbi:hypothetical protein EUGRSUZ_J01666 [Eucalyptus grandis]|uniref:Uncharacterized protein n=2 Tax=Eucalyptus grandis TaxID=71139 RepID=A0ACC3J7G0_EUCGR|nr:hypothetical protein EUGRSUZ_J01666 [Eucalyptus grandis]